MMADANGRRPAGPPVTVRPAATGRPAAAPDTAPKWVEAQKFARQLAGRLEAGLNARAYDSLAVVAPPQFLGLLRQVLSENVKSHSVLWLDKDLTHHPLDRIETDVAVQLRA